MPGGSCSCPASCLPRRRSCTRSFSRPPAQPPAPRPGGRRCVVDPGSSGFNGCQPGSGCQRNHRRPGHQRADHLGGGPPARRRESTGARTRLPVTSAGFLLRADAVFLRDWGLPTASTLRTAKLSDQPYDFHYYTLGNADHTAGFLLMTLVLAAFWAGQRGGLSRYLRALLWVIAAISLVTMFLTYARFAIVTAIIALGILILVIPVRPGRG